MLTTLRSNGREATVQEFDPHKVFGAVFGISSFAGLASLLRSGKPVSFYSVFSAMLNAGIVGLSVALLWYAKFRAEDNIYFLIGVCALAGMGGTTAIDFIIQICKKGGVSITITPEHEKELPEGGKKG